MRLIPIKFPEDKIKDFCQRYGVGRLALFGSVLRGDFTEKSDVNILVNFKEAAIPGLGFFEMQAELSRLLGRKVDLSTPGFVSKYFRDEVFRQSFVVYEQA